MVIRRAPNESSGVNALVQATVKSTTDSAATPATARSADSAATSQPSTASASDATKEKGVVGQARNAPARPTLVAANEADAQLRRGTGDAQPQQRARPAPNRGIQSIAAAPRDRLDERRTALADSVGPARARSAEVAATASSVASGAGASASASAGAGAGASGSISKLQAELKSSDLKKDAVPTAKAITAVAVTGPVNAISIEACFREPAGPGTASILHRVGRIDDSTALAGAAIGMRAEESGFRARQFPAVAPIPAPAPALSAPLARMKIRGDTLFVSAAGTLARIALKTSCPPK